MAATAVIVTAGAIIMAGAIALLVVGRSAPAVRASIPPKGGHAVVQRKSVRAVESDAVPHGMHLVFDASFDGSALNPAIWSTCFAWENKPTGCTNFGNPDLQWFLPSQDQVSAGALHLVVSRMPTPGFTSSGAPETYAWRSGMVSTYGSFSFKYGYVQFTARFPSGSGFWPALWMLPTNLKWPPEIDIAEVLGTDPAQLDDFYHPAGTGAGLVGTSVPGALSTGWHTFAINWEPGSITWSLDGRETYRYVGGAPDVPMYLLACLAVSDFPGGSLNRATPSEASLAIRSVKVYQKATT